MSIINEITTDTINTQVQNSLRHQIVIVGGGAAGITVAAQLLNKNKNLDIALVEPSAKHYYQPAWTLVGAGEYKIDDTARDTQACLPKEVTWIRAAASKFAPENNYLTLEDGREIVYQYLVVCPGIQIDWHLIAGLKETLGKGSVTSNYAQDCAPYTWEQIRNFQGGTAIFTFPATPIKCAGAPQKIMYLAEDYWRKQGIRNKTKIIYCTAGAKIFAVPGYCEALEAIVQEREIEVKYQHNLKEINSDQGEAVFTTTANNEVTEVSLKYDFLHVAPPMSAPDFIKNSPLAAAGGWVDVDKHTLQHNVYPNIFSLGDASSLPTSRTAAAIRKQAPALVGNLLAAIEKSRSNYRYEGYSCCPLITGYGKTIMAEFDYAMQPKSTFPFDSTKERFSMWVLKRHVLPWVYWNRMLKGQSFEGDLLQFLQPKQ
jgi:sulfide:quinone oxidoreductase